MKIFWQTFILLLFFGCQQKTPPPFFAWGFALEGFPITKNQIDRLEEETDIAADILQFYLQWDPSIQEGALESSLNAIYHAGAIPCITWEPMKVEKGKEQALSYEEILNGSQDAYMEKIAHVIKEWKKPVLIRLAHEMNLKRYHWGTTEEKYGPDSPAIYIKMFRYVVDKFRAWGVYNVRWAFCPNSDSIPNEPWNQATHYYPGNDYVDILGMDGYNWAMTPEKAEEKKLNWTKPWMSFEQIFQNLYRELKAIAPDKPLFIFETAAPERKGQEKSDWIEKALPTAKKWNIQGIIWFQVNKEEDWRLRSYMPEIRLETSPLKDWLEKDNQMDLR